MKSETEEKKKLDILVQAARVIDSKGVHDAVSLASTIIVMVMQLPKLKNQLNTEHQATLGDIVSSLREHGMIKHNDKSQMN